MRKAGMGLQDELGMAGMLLRDHSRVLGEVLALLGRSRKDRRLIRKIQWDLLSGIRWDISMRGRISGRRGLRMLGGEKGARGRCEMPTMKMLSVAVDRFVSSSL